MDIKAPTLGARKRRAAQAVLHRPAPRSRRRGGPERVGLILVRVVAQLEAKARAARGAA